IAMKLDDEDEILSVETCTERDDVVLTTANGQCIRFPVIDVRVFVGRNSVGVRGINMVDGDKVISMTILEHVEATSVERSAYIKRAINERRFAGADTEDIVIVDEDEDETELTDERYAELAAREQMLLTVSEFGYGKRSSSYEFRISGRGGKGIRATDPNKTTEIGKLVAAFPVEAQDQIMLVSDGGQLIRVPIEGIRIAGRSTKGVTIFNIAKGEKVVSVERISDPEDDANQLY
ncbi:MAG: DNA gyrase C-terminal beta-propeller domain-containing protein, partial [Bartonella sp.]|nr:DNA gyrase C-terminal beta-propeller domain-containing protein [Bartonella sp.]